MKLVDTRCPICDSTENYTVLYKNNFSEFDFNANTFSARRIPDCIHYQMVRCNNDNLVRANPVLEQVDLDILYRNSKLTYEEEINNLTISYLDSLKDILRILPENAKILEIGCGNGFMLKALFDLGYKEVFGIEPSIDAIQKADKDIIKNITADVLRPGIFKQNEFDFIFFFQTLDHIRDPIFFLSICYDFLIPGGFILAFTHDVESLSAKFLKDKSPIIDIEHPYLYSKETIRKIFEKSKFIPLKIYSPKNLVSLKHLIRLIPLSKSIKISLLNSGNGLLNLLLNIRLKVRLGNICIIAKKQSLN